MGDLIPGSSLVPDSFDFKPSEHLNDRQNFLLMGVQKIVAAVNENPSEVNVADLTKTLDAALLAIKPELDFQKTKVCHIWSTGTPGSKYNPDSISLGFIDHEEAVLEALIEVQNNILLLRERLLRHLESGDEN